MTTDGLLTNATHEFILQNIKTPFIETFKTLVQDSGGRPEGYLERWASTDRLFSWPRAVRPRGAISAFAGLQRPSGGHEAVSSWLIENVANHDVKALHEIHRLASLLEVYKGSPFGDISTRQIHLHPVRLEAKARPVLFLKSACSPGLGLT